MKQIEAIKLKDMKSGAHFLFITDTVGLATADAKVKTKVTAELTALQTALKAEDDALALSKANLLSGEIKTLDTERDKHYKALRKAIKFFLNHPDAEQVKAAQRLERLLKDYNIDPKMQLDRETGLLLNLISDLETKSAADVTALALTPVVQAMKQANDKLREVTRARANDRAVQIVGQLKQAQHASDEAYRALVQKVNALAVVEGEADYADFISKMNEQVKHYKQEVLPKAKKKDGGKQPGDGGKPGEGKKPGDGGKKPDGKKPGGDAAKPGDGGNGSGKPSGNKPGGSGQGSATVTPKE
ncbi:hypothetical protein HMPREF9431_02226 [Segatella oulorum F0390]|uniref:Uncharacterized protein n=1 Tax=Segatella oulorum F0390 TaxID=702438 RepID=G1WEH5_9BACT|nr:DUF6261 family protein [Segatella oulorum]EGV29474.1 hypothetical protein HMPREF9431_02226 [Segatella oulorum F0390]